MRSLRLRLALCTAVAAVWATGCAGLHSADNPIEADLFTQVAEDLDAGDIEVSGEGTSFDDAITVLGAESVAEGVAAEYVFLNRKFDAAGRGWQRLRQKLVSHDGRLYDIITVRFDDGEQRDFYFDAGDFYGQGGD